MGQILEFWFLHLNSWECHSQRLSEEDEEKLLLKGIVHHVIQSHLAQFEYHEAYSWMLIELLSEFEHFLCDPKVVQKSVVIFLNKLKYVIIQL